MRVAERLDIQEIVRVTNEAYLVEHFCLQGDRTDEMDVRARMGNGHFLVIEDLTDRSILRGIVFMSITEGRGYLGTLSVDPKFQSRGIAKTLVAAVEDQCRKAGCGFLDLTVINLRKELFPFYSRLGFAPSAVLPFPRPDKILQPLHLVQMTKALRAAEEL